MKKRSFDVIVIGAGSGLTISEQAAEKGLKTAIVEKGPFGGTCLNRGCIPSKVLIHNADIIETINQAKTFGIKSKIENINWKKIQSRTWSMIDKDAKEIEKANRQNKNITVFKQEVKFLNKNTLQLKNEQITGKKIFICAGTRPFNPSIPGLKETPYLTSDNVMRLKTQPKSMIIVGGGYISAELAHFFSSLGTKITILNRSNLLIKNEDSEISKAFTKIASKKYNILFNTDIKKISKKGKNIQLEITHNKKNKKISAEKLLLATGRVPNTDSLDIKKTNIKTNKRGFIQINEYTETSNPNAWAIGDIAGKYPFKHSANLEAAYCAHNALNPKNKTKVDYTAMPHAIFSSPQIAGVGVTEQELKDKKIKYAVGKHKYFDTGMGYALNDKDGFVKVLINPKTQEILGCHILGSHASTLIHEVIVAMKARLGTKGIKRAVHIHPALPEVIQKAFGNIN